MIFVFIALGALGSVLLASYKDLFSSWNALWQLPLMGLGIFAALVAAFLLLLLLTAKLVGGRKDPHRLSGFMQSLLVHFCRMAFFLAGVRVHATGAEKVPHDRRFMLVCNHLFAFDPLVFYHAFGCRDLTFLSKKENYRLFFVADVLRAMMALPIDRENDRASLRSILKAVQYLKEDVANIAVFPEGYTSKTGELQPFRNGAFKIAQRAQAPIVVCCLRNTKQILKNMFLRRTDVYLDVLAVIEPKQFENQMTNEIGDRVHELMERFLEKA